MKHDRHRKRRIRRAKTRSVAVAFMFGTRVTKEALVQSGKTFSVNVDFFPFGPHEPLAPGTVIGPYVVAGARGVQ